MTRFGPVHWAILNLLLDRKWHSRLSVEEEVRRVMMARHVRDPKKKHKVPKLWVWRGSTTSSLKWMVTSKWVELKRRQGQDPPEWFRINKTKKKLYLNWKRSYERDKASGRVKADGTYERTHGNDGKEQREIFRILARRKAEDTRMGRR
jgi:hypothetical protein